MTTPDTAGSWVWLVYEPGGKVMAVLEDDEDYAQQVAETNARYGWTVRRIHVRRRLVEL